MTKILIGNTCVKVLIDSGVSVNMLNKKNSDIIKAHDDNVELMSTNTKICAYGAENPLDLAREFQTIAQSDRQTCTSNILGHKWNSPMHLGI